MNNTRDEAAQLGRELIKLTRSFIEVLEAYVETTNAGLERGEILRDELEDASYAKHYGVDLALLRRHRKDTHT